MLHHMLNRQIFNESSKFLLLCEEGRVLEVSFQLICAIFSLISSYLVGINCLLLLEHLNIILVYKCKGTGVQITISKIIIDFQGLAVLALIVIEECFRIDKHRHDDISLLALDQIVQGNGHG